MLIANIYNAIAVLVTDIYVFFFKTSVNSSVTFESHVTALRPVYIFCSFNYYCCQVAAFNSISVAQRTKV